MAYIGTQPLAGQYRKLDDISSGFNGATTSFTTSVGGTNVTAGSPQQLLVSLGGVIQQPTVDYTVNTSTIVFTTAPASGLSFFAILMGDALNTSVPADGSITSAKLAGSLSVGLAAGSASTPSLFFTGDTNTGIYSPGADQVAISTNGSGRLFVNSFGEVSIGTSASLGRGGLTILPSYSQGSPSIYFNRATTTNESIAAYFANADTNVGWLSYTNSLVKFNGVSTLQLATGGSGTAALTVDSSQRVGIGSTSPATRLEVFGSASTLGATNVCARFSDNVNSTFAIGHPTGGGVDLIGNVGLNFCTSDGTTKSERARIDSSGRLLVGTSTATTNGGVLQVSNGVTFPAAQSACSDPNTLDDYEEGTWTPTIVFGSGSTGLTYSSRFGYYTKVGNVVTYNIAIALSNKGTSTGVARIGGWPFATTASNNANATGPARMSNMGTVSSTPFLVLSDGSSAFFAGLSTLTDTAFTNTSSIEMSITTAIV